MMNSKNRRTFIKTSVLHQPLLLQQENFWKKFMNHYCNCN